MVRIANRRTAIGLLVLFAAALAVRLALAERWTGYYADQRLFVQWWEDVHRYGLAGAYERDSSINYPPLYLLLMQGYGALLQMFGVTPQAGLLSYKSLLICIDMAALLAAVRLTSGMRAGWRFAVLALIAFNPALLTDGVVWGQVEMLHGMLMVLAVAAIAKRPWLSGLCAALALLAKFQAVTILPILGVYLLMQAVTVRRWRSALQWVVAFAAPWLLTAVYFGASGSLRTMMKQAYADAVGHFAHVSMNAMNVWYYLAGVRPSTADTVKVADLATYRQVGLLIFGLAALLVCAYVALALKRGRPATASLFKAAAAINLAFFMLPTEIHERYSIPALLFAAFAVAYDRLWLAPALALTATVTVNLAAVLRMTAPWNRIGGASAKGGGMQPRFGGSPFGPGRRAFAEGGQGSMAGPLFGAERRVGVRAGSGGGGSPLTADYTWVAAANLAVLVALFWLLWRDIRSQQPTGSELPGPGLTGSARGRELGS